MNPSLFPDGVGNTWGDADAFASLVSDVESKLFARFADDTWFYPPCVWGTEPQI